MNYMVLACGLLTGGLAYYFGRITPLIKPWALLATPVSLWAIAIHDHGSLQALGRALVLGFPLGILLGLVVDLGLGGWWHWHNRGGQLPPVPPPPAPAFHLLFPELVEPQAPPPEPKVQPGELDLWAAFDEAAATIPAPPDRVPMSGGGYE